MSAQKEMQRNTQNKEAKMLKQRNKNVICTGKDNNVNAFCVLGLYIHF